MPRVFCGFPPRPIMGQTEGVMHILSRGEVFDLPVRNGIFVHHDLILIDGRQLRADDELWYEPASERSH